MDMQTISQFFQELGLKQTEIDLLVYLFQAGQATIAEMVTATHMKRSTIYFLLERLQERKLVTWIQKTSRRYYAAVPVTELKLILQEQKDVLESRITHLDALVPEFAALTPLGPDKPKITYVEGRVGLQELLESMLRVEQLDNYYVGNPSYFSDAVGKSWLQGYVSRRIAKHVRVKAIWTPPFLAHGYAPGEEFLREVRFAPRDFHAPTGVFIYEQSVSLISNAREGFGVTILSPGYSETMKSWFKGLWTLSTKEVPIAIGK